MGATTIAIRNTSGTDHLSFNEAGLPGFQFIQDRLEYGRTYHTPMDTWERLDMRDLKVNAVITASFAYNAAMMDGLFPRKTGTLTSSAIRSLFNTITYEKAYPYRSDSGITIICLLLFKQDSCS